MSKIQKSSLVNCYKCFYSHIAGLRFCVHKSSASQEKKTDFRGHNPKAPSGRELPTKSGEGERVTIQLVQIQSYAGSFRHASRATFLPEEGYVAAR